MDATPEDIAAQCAIDKLSLCTECLERFRVAIHSLLDDIHIAEWNGEISQKMILWVNGRYHIDGISAKLQKHTDSAGAFIWSPNFEALDSSKKWEYFDALRKIDKDTEKLQRRYTYYALLGNIEYGEKTIKDLGGLLKRNYHYVMYRKWVGKLRRWLVIYQKRITHLEQRIEHECRAVISAIEQIIIHPLFREMSTEKQNEYYEKWKYYQDEAWKQ